MVLRMPARSSSRAAADYFEQKGRRYLEKRAPHRALHFFEKAESILVNSSDPGNDPDCDSAVTSDSSNCPHNHVAQFGSSYERRSTHSTSITGPLRYHAALARQMIPSISREVVLQQLVECLHLAVKSASPSHSKSEHRERNEHQSAGHSFATHIPHILSAIAQVQAEMRGDDDVPVKEDGSIKGGSIKAYDAKCTHTAEISRRCIDKHTNLRNMGSDFTSVPCADSMTCLAVSEKPLDNFLAAARHACLQHGRVSMSHCRALGLAADYCLMVLDFPRARELLEQVRGITWEANLSCTSPSSMHEAAPYSRSLLQLAELAPREATKLCLDNLCEFDSDCDDWASFSDCDSDVDDSDSDTGEKSHRTVSDRGHSRATATEQSTTGGDSDWSQCSQQSQHSSVSEGEASHTPWDNIHRSTAQMFLHAASSCAKIKTYGAQALSIYYCCKGLKYCATEPATLRAQCAELQDMLAQFVSQEMHIGSVPYLAAHLRRCSNTTPRCPGTASPGQKQYNQAHALELRMQALTMSWLHLEFAVHDAAVTPGAPASDVAVMASDILMDMHSLLDCTYVMVAVSL